MLSSFLVFGAFILQAFWLDRSGFLDLLNSQVPIDHVLKFQVEIDSRIGY